MTITLLGRTYTRVIDLSGATVVIRQTSASMWRVASEQDRLRVLRGLELCPLRVVS